MNYYYTIKTLLDRGFNISRISQQLGIDRKTVRKIKKGFENGTLINKNGNIKIPKIKRISSLDKYSEKIKDLVEQGYSAVLICNTLNSEYSECFKYNTVKHYVKRFKHIETYVPQITHPAEEAQVDFGYVGKLLHNGEMKKSYVFCMVLSFSRYAYYELVLDQKVQSFINCHIHAFEYFGGVPKTVKIDNLRAGVMEANFYEATLQVEYHNFLKHYDTNGITCRIRRGQDKGKVEAGIKYVKYNFIKGLNSNNLSEAKEKLKTWTSEVCNRRIHGSTKKIPLDEFKSKEKELLTPLPDSRYEIYAVGKRIVNNFGHISYKNNYYSVPHQYRKEEVHVKSNASVLKILNKDYEEIAVHQLGKGVGEYVTNPNHIDPHKKRSSEAEYAEKAASIGQMVNKYLLELKIKHPYSYHRMINGIFQLAKKYSSKNVDNACKRALDYNLIGYIPVKRICEKGLGDSYEDELNTSVIAGGFGHNLKIYDELTDRSY